MSKEQRKSLITAIAAFSCLIVVLTFAFPQTFSWLGMNTEVKSKDMEVYIADDIHADILEYVVYRYRIEDGRAFAVVDDPTETSYMVMNEYDMIFRERNKYTPLVIKMTVRKTGKAFDTVVCCGDKYVSYGGILYSDQNGEHTRNNLSNVIKIRCGINSDFDVLTSSNDPAKVNEFYTTALAFFRNDSFKVKTDTIKNRQYDEKLFVDLTQNIATRKSTEVAFHITDERVDDSLDTVNLYFYIDYDDALMKEFVDDTFNSSTYNYATGHVDIGFITQSALSNWQDRYAFAKDIENIQFKSAE